MRALALLLVALLAACAPDARGARTGKLRVTATTGMVADLARRVGGDRVEVDAIMGPGVDPHLFSASPSDLERLRAADLVLYSGRHLEGKMGEIFTSLARKKPVFAVTEEIPEERLLCPPELQGQYDPHIWFDVSLWAESLPLVAKALGETDPPNAAEYRQRAEAYRAELMKLHDEVKAALATVPKERRVLITSHDAFRYFGRAYDLEVRGLQGVSTVQDAGVRDVQDLATLIAERKIKAIFIETSVSEAAIRAVQHAAKDKGQDVKIGGKLFSDAMGDKPPEDTYPGMVRANVKTIVEALR
ncbi:MAG: metal ABC transporter solute-binding protein, Zn/Mn family [Planctomycetota bacterium]